MTTEQGMLFALIGALFVFLIWGRYRYDLVAFGALLIAYLLGLVPTDEVFAGFGHPAVIIIALVLIISRGLYLSGAIEMMAGALLDGTRSIGRHIGLMAGVSAALSAVMNNVAALALLMPIDLQASEKTDRNPGLTLMPLSFASILGGMITLIGTPPNIVIATFRGEALGDPYTMFDFAPVGLVVAAVGIAYVALIGWRLIPVERTSASMPSSIEDLESYLVELRVPAEAEVIGQKLRQLDGQADEAGVQILGLVRDGERLPGMAARATLEADDRIVVEGGPDGIEAFAGSVALSYADSDRPSKALSGTTVMRAVGCRKRHALSAAPRQRCDCATDAASSCWVFRVTVCACASACARSRYKPAIYCCYWALKIRSMTSSSGWAVCPWRRADSMSFSATKPAGRS